MHSGITGTEARRLAFLLFQCLRPGHVGWNFALRWSVASLREGTHFLGRLWQLSDWNPVQLVLVDLTLHSLAQFFGECLTLAASA